MFIIKSNQTNVCGKTHCCWKVILQPLCWSRGRSLQDKYFKPWTMKPLCRDVPSVINFLFFCLLHVSNFNVLKSLSLFSLAFLSFFRSPSLSLFLSNPSSPHPREQRVLVLVSPPLSVGLLKYSCWHTYSHLKTHTGTNTSRPLHLFPAVSLPTSVAD